MSAVPWYQSLTLSWAPAVSFYETRFAFLRALENQGILKAFRLVNGVEVEGKLDGLNNEVSLSPSGVTVTMVGPDADFGASHFAIASAVEHVNPSKFRGFDMTCRLLGSLDMEYDSARAISASSWFGSWQEALSVVDHALLIDGHSDDINADYQAEFGIIEAAEAALRVGGGGRIARQRDRARLPTDQIPPVALFIDTHWTRFKVLPKTDDASEWVASTRTRVTAASQDIARTVGEPLATSGKRKEGDL